MCLYAYRHIQSNAYQYISSLTNTYKYRLVHNIHTNIPYILYRSTQRNTKKYVLIDPIQHIPFFLYAPILVNTFKYMQYIQYILMLTNTGKYLQIHTNTDTYRAMPTNTYNTYHYLLIHTNTD